MRSIEEIGQCIQRFETDLEETNQQTRTTHYYRIATKIAALKWALGESVTGFPDYP